MDEETHALVFLLTQATIKLCTDRGIRLSEYFIQDAAGKEVRLADAIDRAIHLLEIDPVRVGRHH